MIYFSNYNIVFILSISLVYQHKLKLYKLTPFQACFVENKKKYMFIRPFHDFLDVTKSKELYSNYDNFNSSICKLVHEIFDMF